MKREIEPGEMVYKSRAERLAKKLGIELNEYRRPVIGGVQLTRRDLEGIAQYTKVVLEIKRQRSARKIVPIKEVIISEWLITAVNKESLRIKDENTVPSFLKPLAHPPYSESEDEKLPSYLVERILPPKHPQKRS